ncbi:MAG: ferredoxin [SAR202 cluster bacterium]|nr:ferredoxin [SAR202 cluster bacterium]|tara:strand:- start:2315 stop:2539 length:225 start_codon:yes stop_codon:yes gene_type:complete
MARKIAVSVDHDICVGNAMCITIATKAFELNDERQAVGANPDGDPEELILEAAENCPVAAITVTDADSGEQLFP